MYAYIWAIIKKNGIDPVHDNDIETASNGTTSLDPM